MWTSLCLLLGDGKHWTRHAEKKAEEEALHLYENPPISELLEDRVLDGLSYIIDRDWSIKKAAEKAGVTYAVLYK